MKYTVIVTPEAQSNISAAYDYIAQQSPRNAGKWVRGLYKNIDRLEAFPRRFGEAREQAHFQEEIRQVVFKPHRIIYTIDDATKTVLVVSVRHGKMRAIGDSSGADE
jgi:plasmid stabilization system protein ParE